jgi:hypothetical protein
MTKGTPAKIKYQLTHLSFTSIEGPGFLLPVFTHAGEPYGQQVETSGEVVFCPMGHSDDYFAVDGGRFAIQYLTPIDATLLVEPIQVFFDGTRVTIGSEASVIGYLNANLSQVYAALRDAAPYTLPGVFSLIQDTENAEVLRQALRSGRKLPIACPVRHSELSNAASRHPARADANTNQEMLRSIRQFGRAAAKSSTRFETVSSGVAA